MEVMKKYDITHDDVQSELWAHQVYCKLEDGKALLTGYKNTTLKLLSAMTQDELSTCIIWQVVADQLIWVESGVQPEEVNEEE